MKTAVPSTRNPQLDAQNSILKTFYLIFTLLFYQYFIKMFKKSFFIFLAAGSMLLLSCNTNKNTMKEPKLDTEMQKFSYSLGAGAGKYYHRNGLDSVDVEAFTAGFMDALRGKDLKISEADANLIIQNYLQKATDKQNEQLKRAGEDFLAANASKDSVETLPDGLQYKILKKGDGPVPKASDKVKVHYEGKLIDGTIFDSSYRRGEPAVFNVDRLIKGWSEILQMMPVGSVWEVYIPYDLAYGEKGAGKAVPPYSTLIFKVELLGIEK
jgi:FKBP-type peptidyl-prolyl cis-trans isomerase FklB